MAISALLLAGCADQPDYPSPPLRITTLPLARGDVVVCSDRWFRFGFPSSTGASPVYPVIFGFIHRRFECSIEKKPAETTWTKTKVTQTTQ